MNLEIYKTTDIVLASYLKMCGCSMLRIEKQGQKGTFVFSTVDDELIQKYDLGQALVDPIGFNNTVKHLTTSVRRTD